MFMTAITRFSPRTGQGLHCPTARVQVTQTVVMQRDCCGNMVPVAARTVEDGNIMTGAGVSAGLDLGLALVVKLAGEEDAKQCQLFFEYDPQPMFDAGSPEKAKPEDVKLLTEMVEPFRIKVLELARELRG